MVKVSSLKNLLGHLAKVITPWIDIIAKILDPGDCILSMTDSATSEEWLDKIKLQGGRKKSHAIYRQARGLQKLRKENNGK